jgi:signal transduction histidine kinase
LHTMRDRVAELGGLLTVQSAPGEGTTIRARFPLREAVAVGEAADGEGPAGHSITEEAR